jgi:Asp-tRNA(Asn)/Glu-tRNA(Gln) amidotransferase A subunit family amidase
VILGKNNLHEFAYGGSSLVSFFGDVHNPRNAAHIAGGSSGGSAAAVAAGLCYAAIGTDTAGSIREPAALCGCVGIKPTYGRVSTRGVIPLSWSLDHVGPLAATVGDAAVVLQAIAGYDARDINSADVPAADYVSVLREGTTTLRVGIPRAYFYDDLDDEVRAAVDEALGRDQDAGGGNSRMQIEIPTDRVVQNAESYAVHAETMSRGHRNFINRRLCGASASAWTFRLRNIFSAARNWTSRAPSSSRFLRRSGFAGHADDAHSGACYRRSEERSRCAASGGTCFAAQHAAVQCVGAAGDLGALRVYEKRAADRAADCWTALAGRFGAEAGSCV